MHKGGSQIMIAVDVAASTRVVMIIVPMIVGMIVIVPLVVVIT
jgi:hypothetical protein